MCKQPGWRHNGLVALSVLTRSIADRAFDRMAVPRMPAEPPWVRDLMEQIDREFMAGPPLTLHLPVPAVFAGIWAALRESALAGPADRAMREVIAATVSKLNQCPFCVDSHTAAASALGADRAAKAIRSGSVEEIGHDGLRTAARWAAATRSPGDPSLTAPPFAAADQPYAVGTALAFHYVNRMASAFLKPWPVKLPAFVSRRGLMTRVNGIFPGRMLGVAGLQPGASLRFCPEAPRPPELARLDPAPDVARGWAALAASAEAAGSAVLSAGCRSAVGEVIAAWDGADPGLALGWRDDAVASLPPDERPAAAFALTCALASYRVDDRLVASVRAAHPSDAAVVSIAAWASARAARRIAAWL
jgi:AhpD family alkylhydroperoxidase